MFRIATIAAFFVLLTAHADDSPRPQPPPLAPFPDVNSPTEQVMSVESLLAFLPETLATYGEGSAVTKSEIIKTMGMGLQMAIMQGQRLTAKEARDIVHNLVEASLNLTMMLSFAAKDGIEANGAQAQQEVERIKTDVGPDQFVAMVEMQGTTEQEMLARVAKKNVIDRWMEEKVESSVAVSDAEVEAYYNDHLDQFRAPELVRVAHIRARIVASADHLKDERTAADRIGKLAERLRAGSAWEDLVGESDGDSARLGGDLGYVVAGQVLPELSEPMPDAVLRLSVGEVSDPVKTAAGWHLFKILDRKLNEPLPLAGDVRIEIVAQLRRRNVERLLATKYDQWRQENRVQFHF